MDSPSDNPAPNSPSRRGNERVRGVFVFGAGQVQFTQAHGSAAAAASSTLGESSSSTNPPPDTRKHPRLSHGPEALSPSRLAISREDCANAPPLKRQRSDPATKDGAASSSSSTATAAAAAAAESDGAWAEARSQSQSPTARTGRKRARSKTTTSAASASVSGTGNDQPAPATPQPPGAVRMSKELINPATDSAVGKTVAALTQLAAASPSSTSTSSRQGNWPAYPVSVTGSVIRASS